MSECKLGDILNGKEGADVVTCVSEKSFSRNGSSAHKTLIARPGPGNGCRSTNSTGSPRSRPITRTSSLWKSLSGSTTRPVSRSFLLGTERLKMHFERILLTRDDSPHKFRIVMMCLDGFRICAH